VTVRASYSYLALDLRSKPGSQDAVSGPNAEGSSPRHKVVVATYADLPAGFEADATLRYESALPVQGVKGAADLDLRLAWRAGNRLELALVGQGLLHARRLQFAGGESGNVEIQRGFYGKATWRF
jgi:iron complex outermembrane receptor protein